MFSCDIHIIFIQYFFRNKTNYQYSIYGYENLGDIKNDEGIKGSAKINIKLLGSKYWVFLIV
jgi:hypothetical protein